MPLTEKGKKIKANMIKEYGEKKGTSVFYASEKAGTIEGVHKGRGTRRMVKRKPKKAIKMKVKGGHR